MLADLDAAAFLAINGAFAETPALRLLARVFAGDAIEMLALIAVLLMVSGVGDRWRREPGDTASTGAHAFVAGAGAFAAGVLAWCINNAFSLLWFRPRPMIDNLAAKVLVEVDTAQKSFPSDHSGISFAIAWTLWRYDRRVGYFVLPLAALIAIGRVAAGVHYPTDVLAGALVGIACGELAHRLGGHPFVLKLSRLVCSPRKRGSSV